MKKIFTSTFLIVLCGMFLIYGWFAVENVNAVITMISPNGGEHIDSGSQFIFQWDSPPEAVSFKLKLSLNGGKT